MSSIYDWSLTAANNGNADSAINWQEGQLPSTVNNSARQMMTREAEFLKDIGGTVSGGGTANAITATANSPFTAYASGQIVAVKATATNTSATTLSVNAIGAKSVRKSNEAADVALSGGEIISGGVYFFIYDTALNSAAGGWLMLNPSRNQPFATLASAATTDLSTVGSQNVTVTGTTTITAFGTAPAGTFRRLVFSGILTLTHNATSLILPQGGNVVTAAGDSLEAVSLGSGNWRVTSYQHAGSQLISGTAVALSGTSVDFTGLPSWVRQITISIMGMSLSGTATSLIQIGDSGGIEVAGYTSSSIAAANGSTVTGTTRTDGFAVGSLAAASALTGSVFLTLMDLATNTWVISGNLGVNSSATVVSLGGSKATSATLDRLRLTTSNGTDTFDAGSANILYQ